MTHETTSAINATPLDWYGRFAKARGIEADAQWAGRVVMHFISAGLAPESIRQVLDEALRTVRDSGESPLDLFGAADEWADEQLAELSQQGATFADNDATAPELVAVGLILAGTMALLCFALAAVKGHWQVDWPIALAALPMFMALLTVGALTLREWLVHRMPSLWAATVTVVTLTPVAMAFGLGLLKAGSLGVHSSLWWLAQAGLWFGLAWLSGKLLPDRGRRRVATCGLDDEHWLAEARTALRERGDLSESQIVTTLDEARAHAAQRQASLADEFGNPLGYAKSLPGSELTRRRRGALGWGLLAALWWFLTLSDGFGGFAFWARAALASATTIVAVRAVLALIRAKASRK